jgi:hypothetical protein
LPACQPDLLKRTIRATAGQKHRPRSGIKRQDRPATARHIAAIQPAQGIGVQHRTADVPALQRAVKTGDPDKIVGAVKADNVQISDPRPCGCIRNGQISDRNKRGHLQFPPGSALSICSDS